MKLIMGRKVAELTSHGKLLKMAHGINIINKQTSFLENFNLLFSGYGLICISDSHK